jgi:hypothetical protein
VGGRSQRRCPPDATSVGTTCSGGRGRGDDGERRW